MPCLLYYSCNWRHPCRFCCIIHVIDVILNLDQSCRATNSLSSWFGFRCHQRLVFQNGKNFFEGMCSSRLWDCVVSKCLEKHLTSFTPGNSNFWHLIFGCCERWIVIKNWRSNSNLKCKSFGIQMGVIWDENAISFKIALFKIPC